MNSYFCQLPYVLISVNSLCPLRGSSWKMESKDRLLKKSTLTGSTGSHSFWDVSFTSIFYRGGRGMAVPKLYSTSAVIVFTSRHLLFLHPAVSCNLYS